MDTNSEMFRFRADLWDRAKFAKMVLGKSNKEAVEDALVYAKGKMSEADITKKIAKDLNKRKKKMLNRPLKRNTQKQFKTKDERILHIMDESYKEAGLS